MILHNVHYEKATILIITNNRRNIHNTFFHNNSIWASFSDINNLTQNKNLFLIILHPSSNVNIIYIDK